jgi:hypothetical protein
VTYELREYDAENPVDPPDFGLLFSRTPETDSLFESGLTSLPVASNVTLLPSGRSIDATDPEAIIPVDKTARLVVTYDFYQEEDNVEQGSSIEWYVKRSGASSYTHYAAYDGRNVQRASEVTAVTPAGPFQEGDLWYAEVTPRDVNATGETERSNIVRIGTKVPPYITDNPDGSPNVQAVEGDDPLRADGDDLIANPQALEAHYTYVDPNLVGDQTVSDASIIEWFRNGGGAASYTGGVADKVLPKTYVKAGDAWYYVITPYDGMFFGDRYQSTDVTITQESTVTS